MGAEPCPVVRNANIFQREIYIASQNAEALCRSLHIGKTYDQHLEACCRGISSCYRQGTILNSHRVIDIATNTLMVLNCALVTYIMMTADVGLPDAV